MKNTIVLKNIAKKIYFKSIFFKKEKFTVLFDNFSINASKNEIIGIAGRNGSGKSTLIKIMLGLLRPDNGKVLLFGSNPIDREISVLKKISFYSSEIPYFTDNYLVKEAFHLNKDVYNLSDDFFNKQITFFSSFFNLEHLFTKKIEELSFGQKRIFEICLSLLHMPEIIFFDEPTLGLDQINKSIFNVMVSQYINLNHATLIIASNDSEEIAVLATKVIFLKRGKISIIKNFKEILAKYMIIEISFKKDILGKEIIENVKKLKFKYALDNKIIRILVNKKNVSKVLLEIAKDGQNFTKLIVRNVNINETFELFDQK